MVGSVELPSVLLPSSTGGFVSPPSVGAVSVFPSVVCPLSPDVSVVYPSVGSVYPSVVVPSVWEPP